MSFYSSSSKIRLEGFIKLESKLFWIIKLSDSTSPSFLEIMSSWSDNFLKITNINDWPTESIERPYEKIDKPITK